MAEKSLHVFADTNLFLQCKPLQDLAWSDLGDWDAIEVVITRPVQAEIDSLKARGNGRQASRARLASSLIRELLETESGCRQVTASPEVRVCLRHDLRRAETDAADLDYAERDDQLVGTVLAFARANPGAEVRLLTNDTGPMASAKAVGVRYLPIPDDWLLAPEADDAKKTESKLREEIARLKQAEPSFAIAITEPAKGQISAELKAYTKLSDEDAERFVQAMKAKAPIATDFGGSERKERINSLGGIVSGYKQVFKPATPEDIAKYRQRYEAWEDECKTWALNLNKALNANTEWPLVELKVVNKGSRPAEDSLVTLRAAGKLRVCVPRSQEESEEAEEKAPERLAPPRPPAPPRGQWQDVDPYAGLLRGRFGEDLMGLQRAISVTHHALPILPGLSRDRDPNGFYFKTGRRGFELELIQYECAQWRHAQDAEAFCVEVLCALTPGVHKGALEVEVHAANLADPASARVPVVITVVEASALDYLQSVLSQADSW